jgi:excisionase family DNA binding protein
MDVLKLDEAANLLGVSNRVISDMARSGAVPARKVGKGYLFIYDDLINWIRAGYKCSSNVDISGITTSNIRVSVTEEQRNAPTSGKRKHSRMNNAKWLEKESLTDIL